MDPGVGSVMRAHLHEIYGLVGWVRPLVHVVARMELPGERLGEDLDPPQPLHRCDPVPVRHDDAKGCSVIGAEGVPVHLVGDQDPRLRVGREGER